MVHVRSAPAFLVLFVFAHTLHELDIFVNILWKFLLCLVVTSENKVIVLSGIIQKLPPFPLALLVGPLTPEFGKALLARCIRAYVA